MGSRKNPTTSLDAYKSVTPEMLNEHHRKILEGLRKLGKATSEEIASNITLDKAQVYRRMNDLIKMEVICNTGVKKPTRSGRSAFVYKISPSAALPCREEGKPIQSTKSGAKYIEQQLF